MQASNRRRRHLASRKRVKRSRQKWGFLQRRPPFETPSETGEAAIFNNSGGNVPISAHPSSELFHFGKKIGTFSSRTGSKLRCSRAYGDAAGRILKEGGFPCGSYGLQRLLKLTSLVTFLFSDKKVTIKSHKKAPFRVLFLILWGRYSRRCRQGQ